MCPDCSLFLGCSPVRFSGLTPSCYSGLTHVNATSSGDLPWSLSNVWPPYLSSCHTGISCLSFIDSLTVTSTLGCERHGAGDLGFGLSADCSAWHGGEAQQMLLEGLEGICTQFQVTPEPSSSRAPSLLWSAACVSHMALRGRGWASGPSVRG